MLVSTEGTVFKIGSLSALRFPPVLTLLPVVGARVDDCLSREGTATKVKLCLAVGAAMHLAFEVCHLEFETLLIWTSACDSVLVDLYLLV